MPEITFSLATVDPGYQSQLLYALRFASEAIENARVHAGQLLVTHAAGTDPDEVRRKVDKLVQRYAKREFGFKEVIHFENRRPTRNSDVYAELLRRRWVTPVGQGHMILRGEAARLWAFLDARFQRDFAVPLGAELEVYPATIACTTLDRVAHFTSFPEHIDFVSHIREDVDLLAGFAGRCRDQGWKPSHHDGVMDQVEFAISPSCCYHCYEGMEGHDLAKPGRTTTMVVNCHRYEAGNLTTLSRLRSFHMREVVWVGHPEFVKAGRAEADRRIVELARHWDLDCTYENANDMFFTDDYSVKASFQRQQEAKRELRMTIPQEGRSIAVFSSNFHAGTFAKAFQITVAGRPAVSACVGWGYERWVYALYSQFGLDSEEWPAHLRDEYRAFCAGSKP